MLTHRLRERITIQQRIVTQDFETGEALTFWENVWLDADTELDSVPAEVLTGPSREFVIAGTKHATVAARIKIRWFPGFNAAWRILWGDNIYGIDTFEYDKGNRSEIRITCTSGLSEGD